MRYILPTDAIKNLQSLRDHYQKEKKVNLEDEPSIIGVPTFFGGVDVESRKKQISFMEKILTVLGPNLKNIEEIRTPEELLSNSAASRLCLVACWYVQSQNTKKSVLSIEINKALGISAENFPDENDKDECYSTAKRLINLKAAFEEANAALIKAKQKPFSESEWSEFSDFIHKSHVKKELTASPTSYPITSLTQPLFKSAFSYAGATIGLIGGDMMSKTTQTMSTQFQLTAFVGSSLLILGPAGPTGVALFAPMIASKLITNFCSITLAHILGVTMGMVGKGVGTAVGLPLDLAYKLLWKVCAAVGGYMVKEPKISSITGLRIADSKIVFSGIPIEVTPVGKLPKGKIQKTIEFKENGSIYVNGKPIMVPNSKIQLPKEVLEDLKAHFKKCTEEQIEGHPRKLSAISELPDSEETDEHEEEETNSVVSPA